MEGGALIKTWAKKDDSFSKEELDTIRKLDGVKTNWRIYLQSISTDSVSGQLVRLAWEPPPKPICSSNPFPMNSSTSFPKNGIGRKLLAYSDHGAQVLPRPMEFRSRSLPCGISIPLHGSCNGYAHPKSLSARIEKPPWMVALLPLVKE